LSARGRVIDDHVGVASDMGFIRRCPHPASGSQGGIWTGIDTGICSGHTA
jgi:hypothetical protein